MTAKSQLGYKAETTFGTYIAPDKWVEFLSENITADFERISSQAWRAGQRVESELRWKAGRTNVSGTINAELQSKSLGGLFKAAFGTSVITTPGGGTLSRDHTYTLGDTVGDSLTIQLGRELRDQTVQPFSYLGCKVNGFHLSCDVGGLAQTSYDIFGRAEDTATGLVAASYPTTLETFSFVEGAVTVGGTATPVRQATFDLDNRMNTDDYAFGSKLRRDVPEPANREAGGTLDADWTSMTAYNRFVNGTMAALTLIFTGSIIEAAIAYKLSLTANIRTDGTTPTVDGPDEIRQPLTYKVMAAAAGEPVTMVWTTTDTTD